MKASWLELSNIPRCLAKRGRGYSRPVIHCGHDGFGRYDLMDKSDGKLSKEAGKLASGSGVRLLEFIVGVSMSQ
jgi:hypothetical protein